MILSNPRQRAVIENWPSGRNRVTATFEVEATKRGQRVHRTITGKPKATTYHLRMCICDGDDGLTYLVGLTEYGQRVIIPGTLKGIEYYYTESSPEVCEMIDKLLAP